MKPYNKNKNKGKFQFCVNYTKKICHNNFSGFTFYKRPSNAFFLTFIMLKHGKVRKHIEHMRQKLSKNMLIVKYYPGMKRLHVFFWREALKCLRMIISEGGGVGLMMT